MSLGRYGWRRDSPDFRDAHYSVHPKLLREMPPVVNLRAVMPSVYDQGDLGSCTANAIAACFQYDHRQLKVTCQCCGKLQTDPPTDFTPSRLFIYYNERDIEGSTAYDAGAEIRDGIKCVAALGVCPEAAIGTDTWPYAWPYDITKFAEKPPQDCYDFAVKHEALTYSRVNQDLTSLKGVLAQSLPIAFGFTVYSSFESDEVAQSGVVPMPSSSESDVGGHAVVLVGYSEPDRTFLVRNSWGTSWGQAGYFTMPFEYVLGSEYSSDFWVLQSVA